jgi:hypothetical protein
MPVAQRLSACYLCPVRRFSPAIALVVLVLWGLAAMHCKLERLPGLDFLKSCCLADTVPHEDLPKDCEGDSCATVEEGAYRAEEQAASAPEPSWVLALVSCMTSEPLAAPRPEAAPKSTAPPDLPRVWQFASRAALPPRAPTSAA